MVSALHVTSAMGNPISSDPRVWPDGSGSWATRTVIVSGESRHRALHRDGAVVVRTCLDLISQLEDTRQLVATVVLAGAFARDAELASFLVEAYPSVRIVDGTGDPDPDTYLPVYG